MRGMNALFGLKTQVMIGERLIIAVAVCIQCLYT